MDSTIIASIIGAATTLIVTLITISRVRHPANNNEKSESIVGEIRIKNGKKLSTWGGKAFFKYLGSVKDGTKIHFGNSSTAEVTAAQYKELLKEFKGKSINVGAIHGASPEVGTLEHWLQTNVTKTSISTYVAAILKNESHAIRKRDGKIQFNGKPQTNT